MAQSNIHWMSCYGSSKTRNTESSTPSNQNDNHKLRTIPVRLLFNDRDLNLWAEYSMFDRQTGWAICVGNGETCKRFTKDGYEQLPCPSPDLCPLGKMVTASPMAD